MWASEFFVRRFCTAIGRNAAGLSLGHGRNATTGGGSGLQVRHARLGLGFAFRFLRFGRFV